MASPTSSVNSAIRTFVLAGIERPVVDPATMTPQGCPATTTVERTADFSPLAATSSAGPARTTKGHATVTDEGSSTADGDDSLVIGADGFDDVAIRTNGNRNLVTYDDSNVVIGGTGPVNAQIGDSDTGGTVVMGIHGSDLSAGCEGDLCTHK